MKKTRLLLVIMLLIFLIPAMTACGGANDEAVSGNDTEENENTGNDIDTSEGNTDGNGTDTDKISVTLEDLAQAQSGIDSYHFKQTVQTNDENIDIEVYYKDNKMKTVTNIEGIGESYTYFDMAKGEMIAYTPAMGNEATKMTLDKDSEQIPANPLEVDFLSDYRIIGEENINGYDCQVLELLDGNLKVWVITEYGFPARIEMTDQEFGVEVITEFKEISFNDITDEDVSVPADLEILDLGDMNLGQ